MNRRRRALVSAAAIVALSGLVTACSASAPEAVAVVKNESAWTMPLDEFKVFDPTLSNYAEQLLIAQCLEGHGYEWPVPWQDTDFPRPKTVNDTDLKIFNSDIAASYGYHDAPAPNQDDQLAWAEFTAFANEYDPDDQFQSRFLACGNEARDDQTVQDAEGLNYIAGLEIQARDEISADPAVREAASAWKSCLAAVVAFDLPDDPWTEMPTTAMAEEFGLYGPDVTEQAGSEELAVAIADANCRNTSGYNASRYDADWNVQERLVANNRDKLDRIRAEAVAHTAELKTTIAENAPSR